MDPLPTDILHKYGPYGSNTNANDLKYDEFEQKGRMILGFYGYYDSRYLHALGVYEIQVTIPFPINTFFLLLF